MMINGDLEPKGVRERVALLRFEDLSKKADLIAIRELTRLDRERWRTGTYAIIKHCQTGNLDR